MAARLRRLSTAVATALLVVGITALPAEAAAPTVRVSDAQVLEGAGGAHYLAFTVRLAHATARPVVIRYRTADGTAQVADHDYAPALGNVTFHDRKVTKKVYVPVYGDQVYEPTETFKVLLRKVSGRATIKDGTGIGHVVNDDNLPPQQLTVTVAGNGGGAVTSDPVGISCAIDCTESYTSGTTVTLSATPDSTSVFTGWSGGGCSGTSTCTVTMDVARTVTATFALKTYALTVTKIGSGAGTVTSDVEGINCGLICFASYPHATTVTLTATAGPASVFMGWSGGGCSGTSTCVVNMYTAATATAVFGLL